jgi:hypothetical protein
VILSLLQLTGIVLVAVTTPEYAEWCLIVALCVPPFTFYLIALENLLFLLFPIRIAAATPGDFQALGRNVLMTFGKMAGLLLVAVVAGVPGGVVWWLTENPWSVAVVVAPILVACGALLVPFVALAFSWFDVGRDTPA